MEYGFKWGSLWRFLHTPCFTQEIWDDIMIYLCFHLIEATKKVNKLIKSLIVVEPLSMYVILYYIQAKEGNASLAA